MFILCIYWCFPIWEEVEIDFGVEYNILRHEKTASMLQPKGLLVAIETIRPTKVNIIICPFKKVCSHIIRAVRSNLVVTSHILLFKVKVVKIQLL